MKILLRNSFVLLTALLLATSIFPVAVLVTLYKAIRQRSANKLFVYLAKTALFIALSVDWVANVICRDLFNAVLIKSEGYCFGQTDKPGEPETISKVLGINKHDGTLTDLGRALANLLNFLQKDHVERAAGYTINSPD